MRSRLKAVAEPLTTIVKAQQQQAGFLADARNFLGPKRVCIFGTLSKRPKIIAVSSRKSEFSCVKPPKQRADAGIGHDKRQ